MQNQQPLTKLPIALRDAGYPVPRYRSLYEAALDLRIPAQQNAVGRWTFDPEQLPAIADAMGLKAQAHAA